MFCFVLRRMWFLTWSVALFHSSRHLIVYWQLVAHASLFIAQCNKLPTNNRFMHLRKTAVVLFSSFFRALYCYAVSRKTISISKFWKKKCMKREIEMRFAVYFMNSDPFRAEFMLNWQWIDIEYPDADVFHLISNVFSKKKREIHSPFVVTVNRMNWTLRGHF